MSEISDRSKKSVAMEMSEFDRLPVEITENILSRLPVISVFRCRSVRKTWCSIIDRKRRFVDLHLESCQTDQNPSSFLLIPDEESEHLYMVEDDEVLLSFKFNDITILPEMKQPPRPQVHFQLIGSCNGLVVNWLQPYIGFHYYIHISNPATRQSACLSLMTPPPPFCDFMENIGAFGFGFDHSTKHFKLLLVFHWLGPMEKLITNALVYNLASHSWTKVEGFVPSICKNSLLCVNRRLHWTTFDTGGIVSFDFVCQTFGTVPLPDSTFFSNLRDHQHDSSLQTCSLFQLEALNGCLSLTNCWCRNDHFDIWVMDKYNVKESWTKRFVLRKNLTGDITPNRAIKPVCFQKNGQLVLVCDFNSLLFYNTTSRQVTIVKDDQLLESGIKYKPISRWPKAFPFVASLVSPKSACNLE